MLGHPGHAHLRTYRGSVPVVDEPSGRGIEAVGSLPLSAAITWAWVPAWVTKGRRVRRDAHAQAPTHPCVRDTRPGLGEPARISHPFSARCGTTERRRLPARGRK